jgi:hypothetical protein
MSELTIRIHWKGPFQSNEFKKQKMGNGLYFFAGKRPFQRTDPEIQYIGITERSFSTRFGEHDKLGKINRDLQIWVGEIGYPDGFSRSHLETAESIMIYFWQPKLNTRKKINFPVPTTVISHWFFKDGKPRKRQQGIYQYLPDVICWDGSVWRTGNLRLYKETEI